MSISDKIQRLQAAKESISTSITNKGGTVSSGDGFEEFSADIQTIPTGITPAGTISITQDGTYDVTNYASADVDSYKWVRPANWPDLDSLNIPDSFIGTYVSFVPEDLTETYTITTKTWGTLSTYNVGSIVNGQFIISATYRLEERYPSAFLSITMTGINVLQVIPDTTTSRMGFYHSTAVMPYIVEEYSYYTSGKFTYYCTRCEHVKLTNSTFDYQTFKGASSVKLLEFNNVIYQRSDPITYSVAFQNCYLLKRITGINTITYTASTVKLGTSMFALCVNLNNDTLNEYLLHLLTIPIDRTGSISNTFNRCIQLTSIDVSQLINSTVTDIRYMFEQCYNLQSVSFNGADVSNITRTDYLFEYCYNLKSVDMTGCDFSSTTAASYMFRDCTRLSDLKAPIMHVSFDLAASKNLTHTSLLDVLNKLATVTTTQTLTLGSYNLLKLTDEEKQIATDKGWTLA